MTTPIRAKSLQERLENVKARNLKVKHVKHKTWPLEKRIEAVTQWLVLGNMKQVSLMTGIGHDLLRQWKQLPWWSELEKEIRTSQNIEMDTKLSKIVEKSLDATLDRVENGDFIYDQKSGEVRRKPVPLRDVHRVAVDTLAKRELLRDKSAQRGDESQISVEEHLKILASKMAQWFDQEKKPVIELEEVEDAVYEEREARLQEGSGEIHEQAGSGGEEGEAERSPSDSRESRFGDEG